MVSIFIDTNKVFAKKLSQQFRSAINFSDSFLGNDTDGDLSTLKCDKIAKIVAKLIRDNEKDRSYVIFINIEGDFEGASHLEQKGMDILFWIRCKYKLVNPVVLYSFQSSAQLLKQKPENLIMHSEGCYHFRLPFDFYQFKNKTFEGVTDLKNIKQHLEPALDIELFRHRFANKWGITRLSIAANFWKQDADPLWKKLDTKEEIIADFIYVELSDTPHLDREIIESIRRDVTHYTNYLNTKKILYIDDQAREGWSDVLREVLNISRNNFRAMGGITGNSGRDIQTISAIMNYFQPDCILLDLRLKSDENPSLTNGKYSGERLAKLLKEKFVSIPIIMVTASNKVENLRIALRSGCETLWTKEGIDEYKGLSYSLKNYHELVKDVFDACKKFETIEAKVNYESDVILSELDKRMYRVNYDKAIQHIPLLAEFAEYDTIVVDTNLFLGSSKIKDVYIAPHFFLLMYLCKHMIRKSLHFDDDVHLELLRFSKQNKDLVQRKYEEKIIERARYICKKIYHWENENLIEYDKRPEIKKYGKKLRFNPFEMESNEEKKPKSDVHADESLTKFVVQKVSVEKSVLFISDDNDCSLKISQALKNNNQKITDSFESKGEEQNNYNSKKLVNLQGKTIFRRMELDEFHETFDEFREDVLSISILE